MHCVICLGTLESPVTLNCCQNKYCSACITQWNQVRTVCPLCCAPTQQQKTNTLQKSEQNEEFDDGLLILETELSEIRSRVRHVATRVHSRQQQFSNFKSATSSSLICYLERQLQRVLEQQNKMEEQHLLYNRGATVECMQIIAEAVLQMEKSLDTNTIYSEDFYAEYEYEDDYYDEQQEDDYFEYEVVEKKPKDKSVKKGKTEDQKNKLY